MQCLLDHDLLVDRRNVRGKRKLTQRLDCAGLFGDSDLIAQVGEGREIVLAGCLDQLPGRPAFDACQRDVGRLNLVGFHPLLKRFGKSVVEVGQLLGQAILLAAIGGRLEETISLDQRRQLGLNDDPLLLIEGRLGDVIAMGGLVAQLDGLAQ